MYRPRRALENATHTRFDSRMNPLKVADVVGADRTRESTTISASSPW
jgi:hypothetical protein